MVALAGQLIDGAVWSVGITWNEHDDELPASSVAVSIMVVAAVITVPAAGLCVMVSDASQLSELVASPV
jgi:hypothetical protein